MIVDKKNHHFIYHHLKKNSTRISLGRVIPRGEFTQVVIEELKEEEIVWDKQSKILRDKHVSIERLLTTIVETIKRKIK